MSENTLREQIAEKIYAWRAKGIDNQEWIPWRALKVVSKEYYKKDADQILNLLKAELDKIEPLGDEGMGLLFRECQLMTRTEYGEKVAQAALKHFKDQMKELLK